MSKSRTLIIVLAALFTFLFVNQQISIFANSGNIVVEEQEVGAWHPSTNPQSDCNGWDVHLNPDWEGYEGTIVESANLRGSWAPGQSSVDWYAVIEWRDANGGLYDKGRFSGTIAKPGNCVTATPTPEPTEEVTPTEEPPVVTEEPTEDPTDEPEVTPTDEPEITPTPRVIVTEEEDDPAGGYLCALYIPEPLAPAIYAQIWNGSGWDSWDGYILQNYKIEFGVWELAVFANPGAANHGRFLVSYESGLHTFEIEIPEQGGSCSMTGLEVEDEEEAEEQCDGSLCVGFARLENLDEAYVYGGLSADDHRGTFYTRSNSLPNRDEYSLLFAAGDLSVYRWTGQAVDAERYEMPCSAEPQFEQFRFRNVGDECIIEYRVLPQNSRWDVEKVFENVAGVALDEEMMKAAWAEFASESDQNFAADNNGFRQIGTVECGSIESIMNSLRGVLTVRLTTQIVIDEYQMTDAVDPMLAAQAAIDDTSFVVGNTDLTPEIRERAGVNEVVINLGGIGLPIMVLLAVAGLFIYRRRGITRDIVDDGILNNSDLL